MVPVYPVAQVHFDVSASQTVFASKLVQSLAKAHVFPTTAEEKRILNFLDLKAKTTFFLMSKYLVTSYV